MDGNTKCMLVHEFLRSFFMEFREFIGIATIIAQNNPRKTIVRTSTHFYDLSIIGEKALQLHIMDNRFTLSTTTPIHMTLNTNNSIVNQAIITALHKNFRSFIKRFDGEANVHYLDTCNSGIYSTHHIIFKFDIDLTPRRRRSSVNKFILIVTDKNAYHGICNDVDCASLKISVPCDSSFEFSVAIVLLHKLIFNYNRFVSTLSPNVTINSTLDKFKNEKYAMRMERSFLKYYYLEKRQFTLVVLTRSNNYRMVYYITKYEECPVSREKSFLLQLICGHYISSMSLHRILKSETCQNSCPLCREELQLDFCKLGRSSYSQYDFKMTKSSYLYDDWCDQHPLNVIESRESEEKSNGERKVSTNDSKEESKEES